jgi:hypothetical protein
MAQRIDLVVKHRDLQEGSYRSVTSHSSVSVYVWLDEARAPSHLGRVEMEPVAERLGASADPRGHVSVGCTPDYAIFC